MPANHLEALDAAFWNLVDENASLEHVATGLTQTEGPIWFAEAGYLLFSDIAKSRTVRWNMLPEGPELRTHHTPTGNANGLTRDHQGKLVRCEHSGRRVSRVDQDGTTTTIADRYEGKRLNSPNDVVVHSSGAVYFTDPPYGLRNFTEGKELAFNGVFRVGTDGAITLLANDFDRPNGLCFSPDESVLYVADTSRQQVVVFDVQPDGGVRNQRLFVDLTSSEQGRPDGMKVDTNGNLYVTGGGGVRVVTPAGKLIGRIKVPEQNRNIGWGDPDWKTLYMTAGIGLYRLTMKAQGIPVKTAE